MFEKYKSFSSKYVRIPLPPGKGEFWISEDGQVFSTLYGLLPQTIDSDGDVTVTADLWDGYKGYKVGFLVVVVFKCLKLPFDRRDMVEHFHIDGDKKNLHPSNIGYRYKEPVECEFHPGYYHIPMMNHLVISRSGACMNWTKNVVINYAIKQGDIVRNRRGGYRTCSTYLDLGCQFNIGRHRLLCLAFKPYPDNVDRLDVNHINGIPGDDRLDNLEWVSKRENSIHASAIGLKKQNIRCLAKNVFTGEEVEFFSLEEASRRLGEYQGAISQRLKRIDQSLFRGGWMFKTDPNVPWREVSDPAGELKASSLPTPTLSKNVFTGEVRQHASLCAVGKDLDLPSINAPRYQIAKNEKHPYCGYLFKLADDQTPWPEFSERQLAVFRDNPIGHARGVVAVNEKGEELFFTNIKNAAIHFKRTLGSKNDVIKAIARNRVVEGFRLQYL